jgi:predicted nucleotidyltransferase
MRSDTDSLTALSANEIAARAFARRLREDLDAEHVYLFGSQVTGRAGPDSDYDFLIVSKRFEGISLLRRPVGLHDIYYAVGGTAPLDLICLTPDEFEVAKTRATLVRSVLPEAIDLLAETPAST